MPKIRPPKLNPKAPPQAQVDAAAMAMESAASPKKGAKAAKMAEKVADSGKKEKQIPLPPARKRLLQIKRSEKIRKPFLEDADRFFRYYMGDYSKKGRGKRRDNAMSVNIVYSHVEIITPAIFSGFPALKIRPKPKTGESTEQAQARARSMELVIMYWFKELAVDDTLRDVFLDTFFSPAFVEVGWETEIEDKKENYETEEGGEEPGEEVIRIKDRPFIIRRELRSVFLDPDARSRRECRWIAIEEVMKWNDFQASSLFTEKAKELVKPQLYPKSEDEKDRDDRPDDVSEKEWVQIYTIWDRECRKKYVVTEGYPGYLNSDGEEGEEWPYDMEYKDDPFPLCVHDAKRDRATPYSWSEFKAYEPQIVELNRLRAANQIHVKSALPKYIYTDAFGNKQDVNKLMNAKSDEATKVENLEAIKQLAVAEMPKDNHIMAVQAKEDLTEVSGLREYQGIAAATATEASIAEGQNKMRKTMRSKLWEQFVVEIGAKLAQLCQQNMDEEIAIEIAGPNGIEWMRVTKEQIQGEFFFDIEPGIMEYKNEALRMQQFLKFTELMGNDPNVNKRALISKGATMFDFSPEDILVPVDQLPKAPPAEPNIKFKDIDPISINDPALLNQFLISALRQNGVDVGPIVDQISGAEEIGSGGMMHKLLLAARHGKGNPAPNAEPGGAAPSGAPNLKALPGGAGKNMAGNGANPNGNPALPPVVGNLNRGGNPNG